MLRGVRLIYKQQSLIMWLTTPRDSMSLLAWIEVHSCDGNVAIALLIAAIALGLAFPDYAKRLSNV